MNTSVPHTGLGMVEVISPPTTIKIEQDSSPTTTHAASWSQWGPFKKKKKKKLSLDCMCMYIDIFFFLSGKTGQTLCAGFYCACLGRFKKSVILDISFFFFSWSSCWKRVSNGQTAFPVWCSSVESIYNEDNFYLRFIMVCVQHLRAPPLYWSFLLDFFNIHNLSLSDHRLLLFLNFRSKLTAPVTWSQVHENGIAKRKKNVMHRKCFIVRVTALFLIQN